jgi:hypothetical protein
LLRTDGKDSGDYLREWGLYRSIRSGLPEGCAQLSIDLMDDSEAGATAKIVKLREQFAIDSAALGCHDVTVHFVGDSYYLKDGDAPVSDANFFVEYDSAADSSGLGRELAQEFSDRHNCGFSGDRGRYECGGK